MGTSKIAASVGTIVGTSANLLGRLQIGVNKILWGSANTQPVQTVKYDTVSGSLKYVSNIPTTPTPPKANLVNSGLFNALDALNQVDLCNVISYATDNINIKRKPKSERSKQPTTAQAALYTLQDEAELVQGYIDKYTAYPNVFIGSYLGTGPNAVPQNQAVSQSNAPAEGGIDVQKYNMYFLMQSIKDTFSFNSTGSLFTAEDKTLLTTVPGLGSNLNVVDDFLGTINKYSDYRQISNAELQRLQNKITIIRSVCVTIQNLDFKNALALAGNFLGTDIRAQIQQLGKFVNPTEIIKTLKEINSALQSFIKIARQVQGILSTGQFLIKLAILFIKVFKFIINFFTALPIPLLFSTAGAQTAIQDAKDKAKDETDGVSMLLKSVNALLSVIVTFIRYLLANTNELLIRLQTLLITLEGCEAVNNSDVIYELKQTESDLIALREQLAQYIINYDSKIDPNTAMLGPYDIRVVDEDITDRSVTNKRRRGIALDQNGVIVAQSDLTFATNTTLIIEEVKQKLLSQRLVQPALGQIDSINLAIISDSLDYLDNNDVLDNNLNITPTQLDAPNNLDETKGLGLNAFINNLKGGKALRTRTRAAIQTSTEQVKTQVATEVTTSKQTLKTSS
jgi:hypothetical protein